MQRHRNNFLCLICCAMLPETMAQWLGARGLAAYIESSTALGFNDPALIGKEGGREKKRKKARRRDIEKSERVC